MGKMNKDKIRKEIYWLFKDAKFNGHRQIKFKNGKVIAYKPEKEEDTLGCYICNTLSKLEREIAKLFGEEKYYTDTLDETEDKQNGK